MNRLRSLNLNGSDPHMAGPDPRFATKKTSGTVDSLTAGLIDPRLMIREAICDLFRSVEPSVSLLPAPSAADLLGCNLQDLQLIVLHTGSHPISSNWVQGEMGVMTCSGVPTVLLSDLGNLHEVNEALALGARGYILTTYPVRVAASAMRLVQAGELYIPAEILQDKALLKSLLADSGGRETDDVWGEALTQRERVVVRLICEGRRNKEISGKLQIAEATVKIHVRNIMKKLGVSSRTMVVALASGLIAHTK
jgi:DNA-binding CsgD family transcriptional regulator